MESEGATGATEVMQPDNLMKALLESGHFFLMQCVYNQQVSTFSQ